MNLLIIFCAQILTSAQNSRLYLNSKILNKHDFPPQPTLIRNLIRHTSFLHYITYNTNDGSLWMKYFKKLFAVGYNSFLK